MEMIRVILFDADGVVIVGGMFSARYSREFDVRVETMLPFFETEFPACLVGKADLKEALRPFLREWKWDRTADEFLRYWFESEHRVDPRIVEAVGGLRKRGIRCYLATNQEKYRTHYLRQEMGFDKLFDGIFTSTEAGAMKTEPKFYDYVMSRLEGLRKNEVMFWDDQPANVEAARSYGLESRHYTSFENFAEAIRSW